MPAVRVTLILQMSLNMKGTPIEMLLKLLNWWLSEGLP